MTKLEITYRPVDGLIPYARNSRTHSPEQVGQIAASIREFGWTNPILIDETGSIIAGHGRVLAAQKLDAAEVPTITLAGLTDAQKRAYVIADNKLALNAGWDEAMLALELADLNLEEFDLSLTGFSPDELAALLVEETEGETDPNAEPGGAGSLAARFGVPPFTVLRASEGWWQDRKRAWLATGIQSELGRGGQSENDAAPGGSLRPATDYSKSKARGDGYGKAIS